MHLVCENRPRPILLSLTLLVTLFTCCSTNVLAQERVTTYRTHFPTAENSLSEQGKWMDGKSIGLDWNSVKTADGLATGTQQSSGNESVAVMQGKWPADQSMEAKVHLQDRTATQQIILRLRSNLAAHKLTGYAVRFSVGADNKVDIVRANGAPGAVTALASTQNFPVANGDVIKARVSGNVIRAYLNGKPVLETTDNRFSSGAPGIGFATADGGADSNFGISEVNATSVTATPKASVLTASATAAATAQGMGTYTTNFPATENPISEGGKWVNGLTNGVQWQNVRTTTGMAFGTQTGSNGFDDSTAVLTGSWGPNQTAQATVRVTQADSGSGLFEEVEVRLHTTITANSITGYEINCSVIAGNPYMQIVRWNGALGSWTELDGRGVGCQNGDVLKATISGSTITAYKNGSAVFSVNDSTFTGGSPGVGFYLQGGSSSMDSHFGFSSFTASDGTTGTTVNPPTNLTATPH